MKFAIIGRDGHEGQARRKVHRVAHLRRLQDLGAKGRVILAGPFTDQSGSLIVIEASSIEEAEAFAKSDPYTVNGVFDHVEVHPFEQILPGLSQ